MATVIICLCMSIWFTPDDLQNDRKSESLKLNYKLTIHYRMEKSMQNRTGTPSKKEGVSRVTGILLGGIVILSLTMANCQSKKTATQTSNNDLTTDVKFKKDGDLKFIDGKSGKLISKIDIEAALTPEQEQQGLMY